MRRKREGEGLNRGGEKERVMEKEWERRKEK